MLNSTDLVLFQGDSITDASRSREHSGPNDVRGLGDGYPFLVAARLLTDRSEHRPRVMNRGISGNKVPDLAARWTAETVELAPDVLSILIGVNDLWHKLGGNYEGTAESYESGYHELLDATRRALPDVKLVICEPFVLRCGAVNDAWFPVFDDYRAAAREQARIFGGVFVPFQEVLDGALNKAPAEYWLYDGVHPSLAGHQLLADAWLEAVGEA